MQPGQIRFLYMMVHPGWELPIDPRSEIQAHHSFLQRLVDKEECALIHVEQDGWDESCKNLEPYQRYGAYLQKLRNFDKTAKDLLKERYVIWKPKGPQLNFVYGSREEHRNRLIDALNLREQDQSSHVTLAEHVHNPEPRLFARVITYGRQYNSCPAWQVGFIRPLTTCAHYSGEITPEKIMPLTQEISRNFLI